MSTHPVPTVEATGVTPRTPSRPLRALHFFAGLNRGGAETWLMDVLREGPGQDLVLDVCTTTMTHGAYEDEFVELGGRVHRCRLGRNPWRFAATVEELLSRERYDLVHSHLYYFSGFVLRAAARAGVPKRIAHNHPVEDVKARSILRPLYARWMRRWTRRYGTDFVGPTRASMAAFWGPDWERDPHKRVIYNGVRIERFLHPPERSSVRQELGLPADAKIVLNVARFVPHKRQAFLVDVARLLSTRASDIFFVFIGDGPTRHAVEQAVEDSSLSANFRFVLGAASIDRFWLSADAFAFPSINEGFGIVIAEAAAAGLPVVAHDIPGVREAATACSRVELLGRGTSAERWADAVGKALNEPPLDAPSREALLGSFPFTMEASVRALRKVYGLPEDRERREGIGE
ncbi:MAG: glycosyltransferase [Planctomycetota bacterium]